MVPPVSMALGHVDAGAGYQGTTVPLWDGRVQRTSSCLWMTQHFLLPFSKQRYAWHSMQIDPNSPRLVVLTGTILELAWEWDADEGSGWFCGMVDEMRAWDGIAAEITFFLSSAIRGSYWRRQHASCGILAVPGGQRHNNR